MEERVAELEEENDRLRAALNMPPANRVPLGKGPTGKDKPKPYKVRQTQPDASTSTAASSSQSYLPTSTNSQTAVSALSRATSADSGNSTRATSISPTSHNGMQTSPQALEPSQWMTGGDDNGDSSGTSATPVSTAYSQSTGSVPGGFPGPPSGTTSYTQSPVSPSFTQSSTPSTPYGASTASQFSMSAPGPAQKAPSPWVQLPSSSRSSLSGGAVFMPPPNYPSGTDTSGMQHYARSYMDSATAAYQSSPISPTSHDQSSLHGATNPHPASLQALVHPPPSGGAGSMTSNLPFVRRPLDPSQPFRPLPNHHLYIAPHPASLAHNPVSPPPRAPDETASAARNG
jgi:hypothetical protein